MQYIITKHRDAHGITVELSYEEALAAMRDFKTTLHTSEAYDALEQLLASATRSIREIELREWQQNDAPKE